MDKIPERILERYKSAEAPLLEILHALQKELGHLPSELVPALAEHLNQSEAEIHGVISFYHDFRSVPVGLSLIHI